MKAAIVTESGRTPIFGDFEEPVAGAGERLLTVSAAAVSPLVRGRASGSHYSSQGDFPFIIGVDGVGTDEMGRRVYFLLPRAPFGAMAERTVLPAHHCIELPDELDDTTVAAIANPAMSSWAALVERARLKRSETVLINGATGAVGSLAVRIARHLGASRVIATGRNVAALASLRADEVVSLTEDPDAMEEMFERYFSERVDVVLDYMWGASARSILIAAAKGWADGQPIRFVQIGSASASSLDLPAAVLRSSSLVLMGSGLGSVGLDRLIACIDDVFRAASTTGLAIALRTRHLSEVKAAWREEGATRLVLTT